MRRTGLAELLAALAAVSGCAPAGTVGTTSDEKPTVTARDLLLPVV